LSETKKEGGILSQRGSSGLMFYSPLLMLFQKTMVLLLDENNSRWFQILKQLILLYNSNINLSLSCFTFYITLLPPPPPVATATHPQTPLPQPPCPSLLIISPSQFYSSIATTAPIPSYILIAENNHYDSMFCPHYYHIHFRAPRPSLPTVIFTNHQDIITDCNDYMTVEDFYQKKETANYMF
jgi:hypothetical protein